MSSLAKHNVELKEQVLQLQEQLQEKTSELEIYKATLKSGNADEIQALVEKVLILFMYLNSLISIFQPTKSKLSNWREIEASQLTEGSLTALLKTTTEIVVIRKFFQHFQVCFPCFFFLSLAWQ